MDDLVAFLRARFDEDEQLARSGVIAFGIERGDSPMWPDYGTYTTNPEYKIAEAYLVKFGPARVLAEVDAKRRILDEHQHNPASTGSGLADKADFGCSTCHWDRDYYQLGEGWCTTVRLLALPHADHPKFRAEWRAE